MVERAQPRMHSKRAEEEVGWGGNAALGSATSVECRTEEGAESSRFPAGLHVRSQLFVSPALSFTCVKAGCSVHSRPKRPFTKENKQVVWES